jgi:hypothetical protein
VNVCIIDLTPSSPVIPFGIILLILFCICYNLGGGGLVNPFHPKKILAFFGMERINPSQPQKFYHVKDRIKSMMSHGITGLERVKSHNHCGQHCSPPFVVFVMFLEHPRLLVVYQFEVPPPLPVVCFWLSFALLYEWDCCFFMRSIQVCITQCSYVITTTRCRFCYLSCQ